ncbi:MAG TPA: hypothetical protein DDZ51_00015, partial [Planctomycetaceae bacterium]|nr:hypothetical protein [Planctomycetaceae bacterium]
MAQLAKAARSRCGCNDCSYFLDVNGLQPEKLRRFRRFTVADRPRLPTVFRTKFCPGQTASAFDERPLFNLFLKSPTYSMARRNVLEHNDATGNRYLRTGLAAFQKLSEVAGFRSVSPTSSNRDARSIEKTTVNKKSNRLTVERLEARMMFALDVIDQNINELLNPQVQTSNPIVSSSNQAPRITTNATSLSGSTTNGKSAFLTVRATDNESRTLLQYSWRMVSGPRDANPVFSANNSNAAANTAVTFNRAGQYAFQVTVRDRGGLTATSRVNVNVVQVLSDIRVTNPRGFSLTS